MRLVLYSGGGPAENIDLDEQLWRLVQVDRPRMTYIPATSRYARESFLYFQRHYQPLGAGQLKMLDIAQPIAQAHLDDAFDADIIFLGGGNTYELLANLRAQNMLPLLSDFARTRGVLAGLSAGAILMTPTIHTASIPAFDRDANDVGVTDITAMGLVSFEFFPHYVNSQRYDEPFVAHSQTISHPILACPDGAGVVVEADRRMIIGACWSFADGQKRKIAD